MHAHKQAVLMRQGKVGELVQNYWGLAMLHMFLYFLVVSLFVDCTN